MASAIIHSQENYQLGKLAPRFFRLGVTLAALGVLGALVSCWLLGDSQVAIRRFFFSYLLAFTYVLTFGIGALFFVILHHLVGAKWSTVVRRIAEAMMMTLWSLFPFALVLVVSVLAGYDGLYIWNAELSNLEPVLDPTSFKVHEHAMHAKGAYLNPVFFAFRVILYFVVWLGLGKYFWTRSVAQDHARDESESLQLSARMRRLSPIAMILFAITCAFCSYDLLMSLAPAWFSTMFGVHFFAGCAISVMALIALISLVLRASGRLRHSITVEHYHDVGKLLFAFIFFWAYVAFSQFMLIWYANIPEETVFFANRWHGPEIKKYITLGYIAVHWALPFVLLMSRHAKRNLSSLAFLAAWMLVAHWIDLWWLIAPEFNLRNHNFILHPMDFALTAFFVGIFLVSTTRYLSKAALLPLKDPNLSASLKFENI